LRESFQVRANASHGHGPWITAVAQVEDEPRVAYGFPSESGRSCVILTQEFFYLSEQMHLLYP